MAPAAVYRVAVGRSHAELREKGSRFLALVESVTDEAAARVRIRQVRDEHRDASHVCWAWRVGSPPIEGRSDAGEPPGTAGTPILQVLRGSELSDVLALVVRWFGGVKLGKGGLARAYAGATRRAVEALATAERRSVSRLRVTLAHEAVGDLKRLIHPPEVTLIGETYGDQVEMILEVEEPRARQLTEALARVAIAVESAGN